MAEQIVTLSADEQALLKAMQKVLESQNKQDSGWKKNQDSSKKYSDNAAKDAERLERENKKAADAIFREHKKLLDSKELESRKAAQNAEALARQTALKEAKEAIKAAEQSLAAAEKVAAKKRKIAEEIANQKGLVQSVFDSTIGSIDATTMAVSAMGAAYALVWREQQRIVDLQNTQLEISNKLASQQQEATKNLAGTDPQEIKKLLETAPQEIATATGFADLGALTKAIGSVASIIGSAKAKETVSVAATLNVLTPEQLQSTSTAIADLVKATGGTAEQAMAQLLSGGSIARPENLEKLATGAAKAVNAGVLATNQTQDRAKASKESIGAYALLTELDPKGESAATAYATLATQMRDVFAADNEAMKKLQDKIDELVQARDRLSDQQTSLQTQIEIRTKQASKFNESDKSAKAMSARLALKNTEAALIRTQSEANQTDRKLLEAETEKNAKTNRVDPGSTVARIIAVSKDASLREKTIGELKGEAIFKPLFEGMLTFGSDIQKKLVSSVDAISSDEAVFQTAVANQDLTIPQQIARTRQKAKALSSVQQTVTPSAEIVAAIRDVRNEALNNVTLPDSWWSYMGRKMTPDWAVNAVSGSENVRAVAGHAKDMIAERIDNAEGSFLFRKPTKEEQSQIQFLKSQIELINNLESFAAESVIKNADANMAFPNEPARSNPQRPIELNDPQRSLNSKLESIAKLPEILSETNALLRDGNAKVEQQTGIIESVSNSPNAMRAQIELSKAQ